jgi:tRNA-specific 2-thiouridylase
MIRCFNPKILKKSIMSKTVVVAMSGGVDSSVVAAMMHEQGHKVIGITLQLYASF